jgi:four helix bundle protein
MFFMTSDYRRLTVYRKAYELALKVYEILDKFPEEEKSNIVSQLRRAAVSVPVNIAEGSTRMTKKGETQFFSYAYGSCKEIDVFLRLSYDLRYIDFEIFSKLVKNYDYLASKLFKLMKNLDGKFLKYFELKPDHRNPG